MNHLEEYAALLKQAAEAAIQLLPSLEMDIENSKAHTRALEEQADRLRAVVAASPSAVANSIPVFLPKAIAAVQAIKKAARGEVEVLIDDVLAGGVGHSEGAIRGAALINGKTYGKATIYAALYRGEKQGKYFRKDDGLWYMRQK